MKSVHLYYQGKCAWWAKYSIVLLITLPFMLSVLQTIMKIMMILTMMKAKLYWVLTVHQAVLVFYMHVLNSSSQGAV